MKTSKEIISIKRILRVVLIALLLGCLPFGALAYNSRKKNVEYCNTNRAYISVTVDAIVGGKFDGGEKQVDENGNIYIDIENSPYKKAVTYKGKTVYCFAVSDERIKISHIRGEYWQGAESDNKSLNRLLGGSADLSCPFAKNSEAEGYYILEDGTVVCLNGICS